MRHAHHILFPSLQGSLQLSSGEYIFRDDHAHGDDIWAWDTHDEYDRAMVHKWGKMPRRAVVHLFRLDDPPATVPYTPLLGQ